jgi:radical SAM superfamily enzyme YgiQ (UPF0313 family)
VLRQVRGPRRQFVRVHLVNPSDVSFGIAVITPRWLYVLAAATPREWGDPVLIDEQLEPLDPVSIQPGDVVGVGIHTGNAVRGYELGRIARDRGAHVIYGGIHATLYPDEARQLGAATSVVLGDGDVIWAQVLDDCAQGAPQATYQAGRIDAGEFLPARWDLLPRDRYMWASVQTVRGCPKHCSFCSVWRTDGQVVRQRPPADVVREIVELRRRGFRFIALADDNFYPVTLGDLAQAARRSDPRPLQQLERLRAERFELMERLARLPSDTVLYTQITMEAAEDPAFLDAMRRAHILGALVGVESVTPEGLKDVYKGFNLAGEALVERLQAFRRHGIYVLGSFIFGLPSDRPETFEATADLADRAHVSFAQFVMLMPLPGTIDFDRWEKEQAASGEVVAGIPLSRYWLIPYNRRPKIYVAHPTMGADEIRRRTQMVWDRFYSLRRVWARSNVVRSLRGRLAFILISKLYRQMYANTGITTDSARHARSARWARWIAKPCRRLFAGRPMPELQVPGMDSDLVEA